MSELMNTQRKPDEFPLADPGDRFGAGACWLRVIRTGVAKAADDDSDRPPSGSSLADN